MSMTDPIADMLTRIRNAIIARHESTDVPYSNFKFSVAKLLKDEGYVRNYKIFVDEARRKFIKVYINYDELSGSVITGLRRVSKPGRRVYFKSEDLGRTRNKVGIAVVSTSKGLMTGRAAKGNNLGGEVLFRVW
jgi:small subunit ribosomal protein S8